MSDKSFHPIVFLRGALRNSPWVVLAVVLHVIVIAVASIVYVRHERARDVIQKTTFDVAAAKSRDLPEIPPIPQEITRQPVPPNRDVEISAVEIDPIPLPEDVPLNPYEDVGDLEGVPGPLTDGAAGSGSIGVGPEGSVRGTGPSIRRSKVRVGLPSPGQPRGPTQRTEKAVLEGLRWLVRHQHADGSWGAESYGERCSPSRACVPPDAQLSTYYDEGLTGLALLCFLGAGYAHDAKQKIVDTAMGKEYRIGEVVKKGLRSLTDKQNEDGSFTHSGYLYNEALATMALCEAYGLTSNKHWREPARKGVQFLLAAQKPNPDPDQAGAGRSPGPVSGRALASPLWGWRYASRATIEADKAKAEERRDKAQKARAEAEAQLARAEADKAAGALTESDFALAAQAARAGMQTADRELIEALTLVEQASADLRDADISVTTWVVMALKSARMAGIDVPVEEAMRGGLEYARWVSAKDGLVGYQDPAQAGLRVTGPNDNYAYHFATMSSLGMLVRTFVEPNLQDSFLEQAAKQIVRDLPVVSKDDLSIDYYYWYYASLALNQFDGPDSPRRSGKYWDPWNKAMVEAVVGLQNQSTELDVCTRGGWLTPDRWAHGHGYALYATAINVLTLEVYYRFENAFGAVPDRKQARTGADDAEDP